MSDVSRNDLLDRKSQDFRPMFVAAARRYHIAGKVDVDDLVEECVILLNELFDHWPEGDPDSEEFTKVLRTAAYRRVISHVRTFLTQSRNYHAEVHGSSFLLSSSRTQLRPLHVTSYSEETTDPAELAQYRETLELVEARLPRIYKPLWEALAYHPPELQRSLEEYNDRPDDRKTPRVRARGRCKKTNCQKFLAFHLKWKRKEVKEGMQVIREILADVMS